MEGISTAYLIISVFSLVHSVHSYVIGATGKPTSASFSYPGHEPSKAVDGDKNTGWPNVFHSQLGATLSWWQVDLGEEVISPLVTIYFRSDYALRRKGTRISLSNTQTLTTSYCHTVEGKVDGSDIPAVYEVTCEGRGRYLTLSTVSNNDGQGASFDFGEVEVHACSANTFGPDCDAECNCLNGTCDAVTGECFSGCLPGWTATACDQLVSAADVSVFLKYLPVCHVMITFELTIVSMTTLKEMEGVSMETRIDCMHVCDALHLCTAFQYNPSNTCSLWMPGSSSLSETREMWKKKI